ncbi:MAG: AMP-binding protein [Pseudomonadota bacterium]
MAENVCAPEHLPLARIFHWERKRAHHVYLTQPMGQGVARDYTWGHAVGEARRIAAYLKSQGWPAGSTVAILGKNSAHWIMADYAIWMAGYVSVPIYPTLTAESVRQILEHSEAKACFIGKLDGFEAMRPGIPAGLLCIATPLAPKTDFVQWDDIVQRTPPLEGEVVRAAQELATIVYTSGTTGMPKGVMHNFGNIGWSGSPPEKRGNLSPDDRMLSYLPLAHVAERWLVEANSIRCGFHIYFVESLDTFAADLRRARPTYFISVPRLWTKFQQGVFSQMPKARLDRLLKIPVVRGFVKKKILKALGLDAVRIAGGGAAPMPPSLIEWYRSLGLELLEGYGMTENFGVSHGSRVGEARIGYVGHPWDGTEHRISAEGEVQTRGPSLMQGYFKEPEKTRETMTEDGWLRTGDLGEIDEAGRLRIVGRLKEQFKTSKGKYVAPAPIESKLSTHSAIEACCVAGSTYPQPFALLMLNADIARDCAENAEKKAELSASLATHREAVNAQLNEHEKLDFFVVVSEQWTVENHFITPTMKVKRPMIESTYSKHFDQWAAARQAVIWA